MKSSTFDENMEHMMCTHGLFIPDLEYISDLKGLITYLGEKIGIGNICLYCNGKGKSFNGAGAVQDHMRDVSHCKLLYDENEDEYSSFYDFSADYANIPDGTEGEEGVEKLAVSNVSLSEDGCELFLGNGKSIGHRSMITYYHQRFRPTDNRDSVIINKLVSQYRQLGWHTTENRIPITKSEHRTQQKKSLSDMKLGIKGNGLQRHFRHQVLC